MKYSDLVVKLLLNHGADPHANNDEAIKEALVSDNEDIHSLLSKFAASADIHQPLMLSQPQVIRLL